MISAPNHRLPLNGNKAALLCLLICTLCACAAPKKAVVKPAPSHDRPPVTVTDTRVKQYDPKVDSVILVPRDAIRTDTINWTADDSPPVISEEQGQDRPVGNNHAEVALLMPFDAMHADFFSERQDPKLNRFIQYYAGINMAMDKIDSLGLTLTVHSFDADPGITSIQVLTSRPEIKNADVIVGSYEKQDLEALASFGLDHEIMVVSPWLPAFTNETENPFLIQLYPGLSTHAKAISEYIRDEMPGKKVYVVARDNPVERNRLQLFTRESAIHPEELIITDSSPDLEDTDLHSLMSDDTGTVFIMPYFSKADETFVNSFMRKLHADKDIREAIVFGLPQWAGYTNLNPNYMESLALHLSISSFIDVENPDYQAFREGFFQKYHAVPDLNAFLGYDLIIWLAKNLVMYGQEGLIGNWAPKAYGLASGFDIEPVFKNSIHPATEWNVPLYYENQRIRILRYSDQDFILVR